MWFEQGKTISKLENPSLKKAYIPAGTGQTDSQAINIIKKLLNTMNSSALWKKSKKGDYKCVFREGCVSLILIILIKY